MLMAWDFPNMVWSGTLNVLVKRALQAWFNARLRGKGAESLINYASDTAPTQFASGYKQNIWSIQEPGQVRVKCRAVQKYTIYNTGSTMAYLTKVDSRAKRHLSGTYSATGVASSNNNETAMSLITVSDELANVTPAGSICYKAWEPSAVFTGTSWLMAPTSNSDVYAAGQLFTALRQWHAREQFMPWVHLKRIGGMAVAGAPFQMVGTALFPRRYDGTPQGLANAGGIGATINASSRYAPADGPQGAATNWTFDVAWRAYRNPPNGMTNTWGATQTTQPPSDGVPGTNEAFRLYPEFRELRRGMMDRWWKRRGRRMPVLLPGSAMSFKVRSRATVAPWRMALPGVANASESYADAVRMWTKLTQLSDLQTLGMGFANAYAVGGGAPIAIMNQVAAQNAAIPLRYIHCKKTDPMGSAGTSQVTTLICRGNTVPHAIAAPAAGGDFTNAGPAQLQIKRETFWKCKMYLVKRRERQQPHMVENLSYYDEDETGFLNFFKTSPAQSAPVSFAQ